MPRSVRSLAAAVRGSRSVVALRRNDWRNASRSRGTTWWACGRQRKAEFGTSRALSRSATTNCKFAVIIFNPADITGLTTLVHSGLPAGRVSTLAALDSTRLQTALAQHFKIRQDRVTGCRTFGGHGEQMAVFKKGIAVDGVPLTDLLGGRMVNGVGMSAGRCNDRRGAAIGF